MFGRSKDIVVKVADGVLWIGEAAYPLRNVASAATAEVTRRRGRAFARWLLHCVLLAGLGAVAAVVVGSARTPGLTSREATQLVAAGAVALIALRTLVLVAALFEPRLWAMVLETSSSSQAVLISPDRAQLSALVRQIMAAVHNPRVTFVQHVHNVTDRSRTTNNFGDRITVRGSHNTGKRVSA